MINAGATFQRAMDLDFRGLINHAVVSYLDDVKCFSKHRPNHISHLKKVFERCRKYKISLNPKKTIFEVTRGILLGCIVSKDGIMIDPWRTHAISNITYPSNKRAMHSFLGKINFVRRFIASF